jgi:hypothetical protein
LTGAASARFGGGLAYDFLMFGVVILIAGLFWFAGKKAV